MNNRRRSKPQSYMATIAADLDAALAPIITQPLRYCCCHPLDYDISDDTSEDLSYYYKRRVEGRHATTQARHNMNGAARYPHKYLPSKKKEVNISRHQSASSCSTLKIRNTFKQQHQHDQYQGSNLLCNNDADDDMEMEEPPEIARFPILGSSMIPIPKRYVASSISTSETSSTHYSSSSSSQDMSLLFDEEVDL